MGASAAIALPWLLGGAAVTSVASAVDTRNQRKKAENQAAHDRELLAAEAAKAEHPMPVADDEDVRRARRRSIASQMRRRGRAGSILTNAEPGDTLGA